ncbi:hypothetical protein TNCV_3065191 [Trichonephila clavipes]|nr:hypothetical protein TNCV_3065191 [Trichonephila clavipes]
MEPRTSTRPNSPTPTQNCSRLQQLSKEVDQYPTFVRGQQFTIDALKASVVYDTENPYVKELFNSLYEFTDISSSGNYTRAFGDGPRNFEPWSSDVDDTLASMASPNYHTTQTVDVSALDRFSVHRCPTRRVFSGTGLELVTMPATIRYLYHSATAATRSSGISAVASQTQAKKSTIIPLQNNVNVNNNQNPNAILIIQSLQGIISALTALTVQINNMNFNPNPPQGKSIKNKQTKKRELYVLVEAITDDDYE